MSGFELVVDTDLPVPQAWAALTSWPDHGRHVPFTSVRVVEDGFVARTGIGPVGFDDPMTITRWQEPSGQSGGHCSIIKSGRVVHGWAELSVDPTAGGSRVTWRESVGVGPARLRRLAAPLADQFSRRLFGRVLRRLLISAGATRVTGPAADRVGVTGG